jgi:hypothetical protein
LPVEAHPNQQGQGQRAVSKRRLRRRYASAMIFE